MSEVSQVTQALSASVPRQWRVPAMKCLSSSMESMSPPVVQVLGEPGEPESSHNQCLQVISWWQATEQSTQEEAVATT